MATSSASSHCFEKAFRADLSQATLGLPPGFRKVAWNADEDGVEWAIIGPLECPFTLSVVDAVISLWSPTWESPLGIWPSNHVTGVRVAQAVLNGLNDLAENEWDLPPCELGSWSVPVGREAA